MTSHTPQQILAANLARRRLRARESTAKGTASKWASIQDDRVPKAPITPFFQFYQERQGSGDFLNIAQTETSKLIAQEWKDMSDASKQVRRARLDIVSLHADSRQSYNETYREQREDYVKAYTEATGVAPGERIAA